MGIKAAGVGARARIASVDWLRTGAAVLNVAIVGAICYVLVYLPVHKGLVMKGQDQFLWNVFALGATVLVSYHLAKVGSKRELLREARATARSATYRILQARSGVDAILNNINAKLAENNESTSSVSFKVGQDLARLHFADLLHQVALVSDTLKYAEYDWREILSEDWARQSQGETELAAVIERTGQLQAEIAEVQTEIAEKTEEVEREKGEKAEIASERRKLEAQVTRLRQELSAEREKAMTATGRVPFPIGAAAGAVADVGMTAAAYRLAFPRAAAQSLVPSTAAQTLAALVQARYKIECLLMRDPSTTDAKIASLVPELGKVELAMLLAEPEIQARRSPQPK